jgi:hypothetical protein
MLEQEVHATVPSMRRALGFAMLVAVAAPAIAQDVDLSGTWRVFRMETLSIYTLQEHQTAGANQVPTSNQLIFNADGSVSTDLTGLGFQTWEQDQGFLVIETSDGSDPARANRRARAQRCLGEHYLQTKRQSAASSSVAPRPATWLLAGGRPGLRRGRMQRSA